jgi:hypothetical protein
LEGWNVTEEEILLHLVGLGAACVILGLPVFFHALRLMRYDPAEQVRELRQVMAESQPSPLHCLNACTPMAVLPEGRSTPRRATRRRILGLRVGRSVL